MATHPPSGVDVGITSPIVRAALLTSLAVGLALTLSLADPQGTVFFVAFAGIGGFLALRRPRNSVGWLLLAMGWGFGIGSIRCTVPSADLMAGELDPAQAAVAWSHACGWAFALSAFVGITLVFPDGHLPAGRGRWPARVAIVATVSILLLISANPVINVTPTETGVPIDVPNPFALEALGDLAPWVPDPSTLYPSMFPLLVTGIVSLLLRYRRSTGLQRFQYRWLVVAISVAVVANLVWAIVYVGFEVDSPIVWLGVAIAYPCIPIAIAFAIQRYRLYEIDRIISRTLGWAVVSVVLAALFVGATLVLQTLLDPITQGASIAVAASTLLTVALLQPVRARVQRLVDRRFDRSAIDRDRLLAEFGHQLGDELDLEALRRTMEGTCREAVQPDGATVWLRPRAAPR